MRPRIRSLVTTLLWVPLVLGSAEFLSAQGRGQGNRGRAGAEVESSGLRVDVTFSIGERERILAHYASVGSSGGAGLPPGIRKNLARGKPLPPGIARKMAPAALVSELSIPRGYEVVEVGLDVLLVEAATGVIHDVLMDVIR